MTGALDRLAQVDLRLVLLEVATANEHGSVHGLNRRPAFRIVIFNGDICLVSGIDKTELGATALLFDQCGRCCNVLIVLHLGKVPGCIWEKFRSSPICAQSRFHFSFTWLQFGLQNNVRTAAIDILFVLGTLHLGAGCYLSTYLGLLASSTSPIFSGSLSQRCFELTLTHLNS